MIEVERQELKELNQQRLELKVEANRKTRIFKESFNQVEIDLKATNWLFDYDAITRLVSDVLALQDIARKIRGINFDLKGVE
jgi:hypothetical protein